ncbi:MAG: nitrogenase molybdenum-iron protein subunit beta [Spirochaetes bacterium GWF1_31_7]|nr:MAG: nitrogenase molybdenum-iron protein subunit beta [Spirochaetes bacterium GWE1_32_154]OHD46966.1 MAG: nitrogenase molybdenum-iron protein subunit beta [Spirochaetes bacterium GWF1_31_7]OHD49746.1 MAG: nitrogenase molybdenum-iron protein subunit beta [Spirochaetes bacterium GWE2_31_10]OHD80120.1 MAG: nitrogenase molybdenum-iron protein subunit beta [Spirochaetes bacterium RIFOXYB1_FULL_32_8]HBD95526.1 nitrogenase molybdenum-iron protein subunit beta [Spirochaetia bacterium]
MLLRHTPQETIERKALTINPAKTCQPIGAMYAALGIHNCLPHSHGSQGCCSYHRSTLTRHFKEPAMASTSSFTEGSSVFGGQANLVEAINNIFTVYNPDVIAVHTTCLSETIGDDLTQMAQKAKDEGYVPAGKKVIYASTPSYVGSHVTGYANMVRGMVDLLAVSTTAKKLDQINVIPGFVEPSDMAEIKRIAELFGKKVIMYPDTSNVLNSPMTGKFKMYPKGGAKTEDIALSGDSKVTLALGRFATGIGAKLLDTKHKVPCELLDLPIGLAATDRYVEMLKKYSGQSVPESLMEERGQLVDMITDMHQYFYGKKVALAGDPDQLVALTEFLISIDMKPVHIVTGTPGNKFERRIKELTENLPYKVNYTVPSDLFTLHQWIKNESVDLIIGNTYTKYIARDEDIPSIRFGFPILDRVGHQYFPMAGYKGAMRLLEKILTCLLDKQDKDAPEEKFELVM